MWETWKAHHKTRNTYFKFELESVTQSQCTSLVGDLDNFGGRLGKFSQQNIWVNSDTMACETHGIHSTRHNGDGLPPHQRVDRKRETRHGTRNFCLEDELCH